MRTKAVLVIIGFLFLICLSGFLWGNSLITWTLKQSFQAITGAQVDIEGFRLNPFKMSVRIGRVAFTNPADTWKNIIETQKIRFKLAPGPLFEGKTVIDELIIEDLTFNSPRQTDGKIEKKALPGPAGNAQNKLAQSIAQMPILKPETIAKNLDLDEITASYQFKTSLSAEKIKADLNAYQKKWDANLSDLKTTRVQLQGLEDNITRIKSLNSKDLSDLKQQIDLINQTQKTAKKIRAQIKSAAAEFKKDNQTLEAEIKSLRQEAENDYQALLALAKVPDIGNINYTEALLGKTMLNASTIFLKLADNLQKSLPVKVEQPPKEKHPRGGQNITFPGRKTYPRFLIKKIAISGKGTPGSFMDGFYAKGIVTGITSEPPIYGLPINASVLATAPNQASLELDGEINHVTPNFYDQINLKLKNLPLPQLNLAVNDYLASKISSGQAEIEATMEMTPGSMQLRACITGVNIKSDYPEKTRTDDLILEIVRSTLTDLNQVTVNYQLERTADRLKMKLSSNLDQLIATGLKKTIGEKVTGFTRELRAKIDAKLLEEEQALLGVKQQYQKEIDSKLNEIQTQLDLKERELEAKKKELETKIKQKLF